MLKRTGKVGVIWPNNRDIAELVPYLGKIAVVALVFPTFRDGRAYSQARLLRERYNYRGDLRATGQILRDQFVFMLRAGFDSFDVKKQADAEAFMQTAKRYSVFYQPTGDGRITALHRRNAAASLRRCRHVNAIAPQVPSMSVSALPSAEELDHALRDASPAEIIAAALKTVGREKLALVSSFGTESATLLKVMADVDPAIPVIFLDTGWLFEETLAYRDTLIATLGLTDVRSIKPAEETLSREDPDRDLWFSDPDACCRIRKVEPLARALKPFDAWLNGRKRFQGSTRADIPVVEDDGARLKFNPFANVSREELEAIFARAKLPRHPLVESGFLSVGCMPCTSRTAEGEDERAGRWRGRAKTECGIHTMKIS
ncbi:phosphoadenylyl-sulfate reductase (thioredoxin) [Bradyrhizobium sp. LM3.2]